MCTQCGFQVAGSGTESLILLSAQLHHFPEVGDEQQLSSLNLGKSKRKRNQ